MYNYPCLYIHPTRTQFCLSTQRGCKTSLLDPELTTVICLYRIAGSFRWCKFSYELPIFILNIRTTQHSDVEHT